MILLKAIRDLFYRVTSALSLGLILFIFSEEFFWGFYRRGSSIFDYLETYIVYALFAYIFLILLYWSGASNIWEVFLLGAIYGWVIEGLFVQTVYENLPYSISWTSLAWHALITIIWGFYLVYQSAVRENYYRVSLIFVIIGLLWGILATYWIIDLGYLPGVIEFSLFVLLCALLLGYGYVFFVKLLPNEFNPSKPELIILLAFLGLIYVVVASVTILIVIIWTPLILVTLLALWRNRKRFSKQDPAERITFYERLIYLKNTSLKRLFYYPLLIPLFSTITYSIQLITGTYLGYFYMLALYVITMPLGVLFYIVSILKALK